jgi:trimeric autotransporter adhesin
MVRGCVIAVVLMMIGCGGSNSPHLADAHDDSGDALQLDAANASDAPLQPVELTGKYTYVKASNTETGDLFGQAIAISGDGNTVVVATPIEASAATVIDGDQTDNSATGAGAVYVFTRSGTTWAQQAYIKSSNIQSGDQFGYAVALSHDGNTLAVGAQQEDSCSTDPQNNGCSLAGAAYVFTRSNGVWSEQAIIKASNASVYCDYGRYFGAAVTLSSDGNTLAVGSPGDCSATTGVNGDATSIGAALSGAAYIYTRAGTTWSQQAYLKASNTGFRDEFGFRLALSGSGDLLIVGAPYESSSATGINGSQSDNGASEAGAAYLFKRNGTTWAQQLYIKASNADGSDHFGDAVAFAANGSTFAVGAYAEASHATGIDGDQADDTQLHAGATYLFQLTGSSWAQSAYVKGALGLNNNAFGSSVALSADGNTLTASAPNESSGGSGLLTGPVTPNVNDSGSAYLFRRTTAWTQHHYFKASNPGVSDGFGASIAQSADSRVVVVAARGEDSAATGIDGDQTNNGAMSSGAVYIIE